MQIERKRAGCVMQLVPPIYRAALRSAHDTDEHDVDPQKFSVLQWTPRNPNSFETSGEDMLEACIGMEVTTIYDHHFFMRNPSKVPEDIRGKVVYSPGTLFWGDKGTIYCPCWYFIGGQIQEDFALIAGEVQRTYWQPYQQVIGLMPGRPRLKKVW